MRKNGGALRFRLAKVLRNTETDKFCDTKKLSLFTRRVVWEGLFCLFARCVFALASCATSRTAEGGGSDAGDVVEDAGEVVRAVEAALYVDVGDGQFGVAEQATSALHALMLYVLCGIHAQQALDLSCKLALAHTEMTRQFG